MASVVKGVYRQLKDFSLPVQTKLKLVTYSWDSDRVFIPNKSQVLIDTVCGFLLNKKTRLKRDDDVEAVWKCLYSLLQTEKAHQPTSYSQALVIKPSLCEIINNSIWEYVTKKSSNQVKLDYIIGCCHSLLTSPTLSYLFRSKVEYVLRLLNALCLLTTMQLDRGVPAPGVLAVLEIAASIFCKCQQALFKQKEFFQLFCNKLFTSVTCMWFATSPGQSLRAISGDLVKISRIHEELTKILYNTLFDQEHIASYTKYLSVLFDPSDKVQLPMFIGNLFQLISDSLQNKKQMFVEGKSQKAMLEYIPTFFSSFLESSEDAAVVGHQLFVLLCDLLGITAESNALCGSVEESEVIRVLNQLLEVVKKSDIYDVAQDSENGGVKLRFYQNLVVILLQVGNVSRNWYGCLRSLLHLNHEILEARMTSVLGLFWLSVTELDEDSRDELDSFLSEMTRFYAKLRQLPQWFGEITKAIVRCTHLSGFYLPPLSSSSFVEATQALPQVTAVVIWENFHKSFYEHFLPATDIEASADKVFVGFSELFSKYLWNIKVADYSVTNITAKRVAELMDVMKTDILVPLLDNYFGKKDVDSSQWYSVLLLCYTWGELKMMFAQNSTASLLPEPLLSSNPEDLSLVHTYFPAKRWLKIWKRVVTNGDKRTHYLLDAFMVQKLKAVLPRVQDGEEVVGRILETFIRFPEVMEEEERKQSRWAFISTTIPFETYLEAKWNLITTNLPIFISLCSKVQCSVIAKYILNSYQTTSRESQTLMSITENLLNDPTFQEFRLIHSSIITSVWSLIGRGTEEGDGIPRQKKLKLAGQNLEMIFLKLGDDSVKWSGPMQLENSKVLQDVANDINSILFDLPSGGEKFLCRASQFLKVLSSLPLRNLEAPDYLRCTFGFLLLLRSAPVETLTSSLDPDAEQHKAASQQILFDSTITVIRCLSALLNSIGPIPIFGLISAQSLITFVRKLLSEAIVQDAEEKPSLTALALQQLLQQTVVAALKNFKLLTELSPFITQLHNELNNKEELLVCSSNITLYRNYSAKFMLLSITIEQLSTLLFHRFIQEEVKVCCREYLTRLVEAVMEACAVFSGCDLRHAPLPVSIMDAYAAALAQSRVLVDGGGSLLDSVDVACYIDTLRLMCDHSLHNLTNKDSTERCKSSLELLHIILEQEDLLGFDIIKKKVKVYKDLIAFLYSAPAKRSPKISSKARFLLAALLTANDYKIFALVCNSLLTKVDVQKVHTEPCTISTATEIWMSLLEAQPTTQYNETFGCSLWQLLHRLQAVLQQLHGRADTHLVGAIAIPVLQFEVQLLNKTVKVLPPEIAMHCILSCQCVPLTGLSLDTFTEVFHSLCDILHSLLTFYTGAVLENLPSFINCIKRLLVALIEEADQDRLLKNAAAVEPVCKCAYHFESSVSYLAKHKVELSKVVTYLVADCIDEVQKKTLLPAIKSSITSAIYSLLDICDEFAISQLQVWLDQSTRELFKSIYSNYIRHHKYRGKI